MSDSTHQLATMHASLPRFYSKSAVYPKTLSRLLCRVTVSSQVLRRGKTPGFWGGPPLLLRREFSFRSSTAVFVSSRAFFPPPLLGPLLGFILFSVSGEFSVLIPFLFFFRFYSFTTPSSSLVPPPWPPRLPRLFCFCFCGPLFSPLARSQCGRRLLRWVPALPAGPVSWCLDSVDSLCIPGQSSIPTAI